MPEQLMIRISWATLKPLIEEAATQLFHETRDEEGDLGKWMHHSLKFDSIIDPQYVNEDPQWLFLVEEGPGPPRMVINYDPTGSATRGD